MNCRPGGMIGVDHGQYVFSEFSTGGDNIGRQGFSSIQKLFTGADIMLKKTLYHRLIYPFFKILQTGTEAMIADQDTAVTNREVFWSTFKQLSDQNPDEMEAFFSKFYAVLEETKGSSL